MLKRPLNCINSVWNKKKNQLSVPKEFHTTVSKVDGCRDSAQSSTVQKKRQRDSSPILIRTLKTDTHGESELIIVQGNGRRRPI